MENQKIAKIKIGSIFKTFILLVVGIILIVCTAIALRSVCANKFTPARASEYKFVKILSDTPLYKNNDLTHEIIRLPSGYFAKELSRTNNLSRVEYNGTIGYINNLDTTYATIKNGNAYKSATLYTRSDAGTHLRTAPTTTSDKTYLIPAGSTLSFVGEISGDIPTDGTSPVWYYVHFNSGDTTTHTGYIYSERTIITNISSPPEVVTSTETTLSTQTSTPNTNTDIPQNLTTPLSSGLKIFLIILFAVLGVIIFALLLISPKSEKLNKKTNNQTSSSIPPSQIPAYNQPEFGNFVEFTQPQNNNTYTQQFSQPSKVNSHKKQINISHPTKAIENKTLPPAIAKYFKTEDIFPPSDDDELL